MKLSLLLFVCASLIACNEIKSTDTATSPGSDEASSLYGYEIKAVDMVDGHVHSQTGDTYILDRNQGAVFVMRSNETTLRFLSNSLVGTGPYIRDPFTFSVDETSHKIYVAAIDSIYEVDMLNGNRRIVASDDVGIGPSFYNEVSDMVFDPGSGKILVVFDRFAASEGVFSIDPSTGDRVLLTGRYDDNGNVITAGSGSDFRDLLYLEMNTAENLLYVFDIEAIFKVDLSDGSRSVLTGRANGGGPNANVGSGFSMASLGPMFYDEAAGAILTNAPHLFSVDKETGYRDLMSNKNTMSGVELLIKENTYFKDSNGVLKTVRGSNIIEVNQVNGDFSVDRSFGVGSGPATFGSRFVYDSDEDVFYTMPSIGELIKVDRETGDRDLISASVRGSITTEVGTGPFFGTASGVVHDKAGQKIYAMGYINGDLIEIDLTTGNRSVFSGPTRGTGPSFGSKVEAMVLDSSNNRIIGLESSFGAVIAFDLTTGNRTMLSGVAAMVGDGPTLRNASGLKLDLTNENAYVVVSDINTFDPQFSINSVIRVNLASGDRVVVIDNSIGVGDNFVGLGGAIDIDFSTSTVFLDDILERRVFKVDMNTGNRTVISGPNLGAGPGLGGGVYAQSFSFTNAGNNNLIYDPVRDQLYYGRGNVINLETGNRFLISN